MSYEFNKGRQKDEETDQDEFIGPFHLTGEDKKNICSTIWKNGSKKISPVLEIVRIF